MIEVTNLCKKYGNHTAVSDLSFKVEEGQIYGFLGPNGAGKSTTMNIITGCLAATSGDVKINGHDIFEEPNKAKKLIGYLPEIPPLYTDMTPYEYLCFVSDAKAVDKKVAYSQIEEIMDLCGLTNVKSRLIKNLSKGYRQRVGIAQAMIGNPAIIILDEPTVGLDPKQILEIRELIKNLGKNHTVILSSHILPEVEAVCDHIMIISDGKLVASDTPENLRAGISPKINLTVSAKCSADKAAEILSAFELNIVKVPSENEGETTFEISFPCENDLRESIFYAFADNRCPIVEMHSVSSSLEDIYLRMTSEEQLDLEETEETVEVEEMQTAVEDSQETVEEAEQTEGEENADVGNI